MYDNLPWSQKELELIRIALAVQPKLTSIRPLLEHRYEAIEHYKAHFKNTATRTVLDGINPSQPMGLDQHGFDLLTVRTIRHRHTNYGQFWIERSNSPIQNIIWLIGFLKIGKEMKLRFPELADAITLETIKRVSVKDRAMLRNTILMLADQTEVGIYTQPYAELRTISANRYNKMRLLNEQTQPPMDASSTDEIMQARINERIVSDFISRNCDRVLRKLGIGLLDDYHAFFVRERVCRRAFTAVAERYPELADTCQRRMEAYSARLDNLMKIDLDERRSKIYAPAISRVLARTVKTYNDEHRRGISEGTEPRLYLAGAPQEILALIDEQAVRHILSRFSRYDEFMEIAASLPEPVATTEKEKVRRVFLGKVQELYPELSDVIRVELQLLGLETEHTLAS